MSTVVLLDRIAAESKPSISLEKTSQDEVYHVFLPIPSLSTPNSPLLLEGIAQLEELFTKKKPDAIVATVDLTSLIAAHYSEKFGLRSSTVATTLLVLDKAATRKHIPCSLKTEVWDDFSTLPQMPFPFYLKAPFSALGKLGFTIRNESELQAATKQIIQFLPRINQPIRDTLVALGRSAQAESITDCMLVETICDQPQVTVEGCIQGGKVTPLYITDTNFRPHTRQFESFTTPSRHTLEVQAAVKDRFISDCQKLGLDMIFCNAEYWIMPDGSIELIEVNSRAAYSFRRIYAQAYGIDLLEQMTALSSSKSVNVPDHARAVAGQFNLFTNDKINHAELAHLSERTDFTKLFAVDTSTATNWDAGTRVAQFELHAKNWDELQQNYQQILAELAS